MDVSDYVVLLADFELGQLGMQRGEATPTETLVVWAAVPTMWRRLRAMSLGRASVATTVSDAEVGRPRSALPAARLLAPAVSSVGDAEDGWQSRALSAARLLAQATSTMPLAPPTLSRVRSAEALLGRLTAPTTIAGRSHDWLVINREPLC